MTKVEKQAAQGTALFDPRIRFSAVAVNILEPVTMATTTRAKHVLVIKDLFTMYTTADPLASTNSADVAR